VVLLWAVIVIGVDAEMTVQDPGDISILIVELHVTRIVVFSLMVIGEVRWITLDVVSEVGPAGLSMAVTSWEVSRAGIIFAQS
jgi:hypothetical protein